MSDAVAPAQQRADEYVVVCGRYLVPSDVNAFKALIMEKLGVSSNAAMVAMDLLQHPGAKQYLDAIRTLVEGKIGQLVDTFEQLGTAVKAFAGDFQRIYAAGLEELRRRFDMQGIEPYVEACEKIAPRVALGVAKLVDVLINLSRFEVKMEGSKNRRLVLSTEAELDVYTVDDELSGRFLLTRRSSRIKIEFGTTEDLDGGDGLVRRFKPIDTEEFRSLVNIVVSSWAFSTTEVVVEDGTTIRSMRLRELLREVYGESPRLVDIYEATVLAVLPLIAMTASSLGRHAIMRRIYIVSGDPVGTGNTDISNVIRNRLLGHVIDALTVSEKVVCVDLSGSDNPQQALEEARKAVQSVDPGAYLVGVRGSMIYVPHRLFARLVARRVRRIYGTDVITFAKSVSSRQIVVGRATYYEVDMRPAGYTDAGALCHRWLTGNRQGNALQQIREYVREMQAREGEEGKLPEK